MDPVGFAGKRSRKSIKKLGTLHASISAGDGCARLEQLWNTEGTRGIQFHSPECVSVLSGRAFFLPPKMWTRLYLPYCVHMEGGVSLTLGLQREGLIAGLAITRAGQLRVNVWNSTDATIYLTPKTSMVHVHAAKIFVRHLGRDSVLVNSMQQEVLQFGERLREEISSKFPTVGDFSTHPVNSDMEKLKVRANEVVWVDPPERGCRTQYSVESVADRKLVDQQLRDYVHRGYLETVSVGEDTYLSPLLPVRKPNGTFRFTNDFRKLNSYFPSGRATTQVDVWRKMWELKPDWKYFVEIDLKDGFFGIPVEKSLSMLFGFTYGTRRYRWKRLPQGWKWSSVLFHERIAEILDGLPCPQYSDNVLIGASTLEELREATLKVFSRFNTYGIKVNFDKVKWLTREITFLGNEIRDGQWSQEGFLHKRMQEIGFISTIKGLERVIGILSYSRRCIKDTEKILGPLREDLRRFKSGIVDSSWLEQMNERVRDAFRQALDSLYWLVLPGMEVDQFEFRIESDWSSGHSGYMLFGCRGKEQRLLDLGSRAHGLVTSSYLGELDAIVWACKRTKSYRGSVPLVICTDSHSIFMKAKSGDFCDPDIRAFRRWAWLVANEPGFRIEFVPGVKNSGADLLSRPPPELAQKKGLDTCGVIQVPERMSSEAMAQLVWDEHLKAHWGAFKVYHALRQQGIPTSWKLVKEICATCEICAKFRQPMKRREWSQPPFSVIPGHTLFLDVVGPLIPGRGGVQYIQCIVDSATRMSAAIKVRRVTTANVIRGLEGWIDRFGKFKVMVTDNASYYTSNELQKWCEARQIMQVFSAPYRHQSVGLVERYHKTLIDRIRKLRLTHGGSWSDYLESAVDAMNTAIHSTTGFSSKELWEGTDQQRELAFSRTKEERESRFGRKKIFPKAFQPGQIVLVYDEVAASSREDKFQPFWKGPFILMRRLSPSLWEARRIGGRKRGRKVVWKFHEDQLQPFDLP